MSRFRFTRSALARAAAATLALPSLLAPAVAQTAGDAPVTSTVVVTGNPLRRDELQQPSSVLAGDRLSLQRGATLGETLASQPGVAASGYGPQVARPVIRGLDGDRIRLLDNGGASADASNLSFDHAVALDPLVVERIEVLRGPAALLYGGNATGGVVNTIDNRVPRAPIDGLLGRAELRLGGASAERAAAALLEGGQGGLAWHADVAGRDSSDLRVPRFGPAASTRVANSAGDSRSGALGAAWTDADGFVGASVDSFHNDYGVAIEPDVTIRMRRERAVLSGERRRLDGPFTQIHFQFSQTRYRHDEVEGDGAIGTTFRSTGRELRLQAQQAQVGALSGVLGVQAEQLDFAALGDEAFVPATRTRSQALFALEEWRLPAVVVSAGLRIERARVASDGDAADSETMRFGAPAERRFAPRSSSLGVELPFGAGWSASAGVGRTQRTPAYYELYANGVHVATGAFERGDPALGLERSTHSEAGLQWKAGRQSLRASLWRTRFANYIALDASGAQVALADGSQVPEYRFIGVPARLSGWELEARSPLTGGAWPIEASASFDSVRGDNRASGEPLPRIAPRKLALGLDTAQGAWRMGVQLQRVDRQDRVPSNDIATPGYTMLRLWAGLQTRLGGTDAQWLLKLDNATNALAFNAATIRTARDLSPLGARALTASLRVAF